MTELDQTTPMNCFQACFAMILDVPIEAVPDFANLYSEAVWFYYAKEFFKGIGLTINCWGHIADYKSYYIAIYERKSGMLHAVVMKKDKIVFDPAPGDLKNKGLGEKLEYNYILDLLETKKFVDWHNAVLEKKT